MSAILQVAWYWEFAQSVQNTVDTRNLQHAATIAAGIAFLLYVSLLYKATGYLKERYDEDGVEILMALLGTAGAIGMSVFIISVWRQMERFIEAVGAISLSAETGILLLVSFVVLAVTYTMTRITKRLIKFGSGRIELTPHQRELVHHFVQIFLFLTAFAFIWFLWNLEWSDVILGAGAIGIIVGFAARKTLSGVLAGFVLLFARPFEVGDWIDVGDREGIVTQITIYNTQIRTFNEEHVVIPNDGVIESEVVNYSKTDRLRINTKVGIDYKTDISTAMSVATEAMKDCETVADRPEPDVILDSFSDSSIVLRLRYWITRPTIQHKLSAQNEVVEGVKRAFEEEGIKIPFPQRELMGREDTDGLRVAADRDVADGDEEFEKAVRRVTKADNDRVEEAVEQVSDVEAPTIIEEPVEDRYGGDGGPDQEADEEDDTDGTEGGDDTEGAGPVTAVDDTDLDAASTDDVDGDGGDDRNGSDGESDTDDRNGSDDEGNEEDAEAVGVDDEQDGADEEERAE